MPEVLQNNDVFWVRRIQQPGEWHVPLKVQSYSPLSSSSRARTDQTLGDIAGRWGCLPLLPKLSISVLGYPWWWQTITPSHRTGAPWCIIWWASRSTTVRLQLMFWMFLSAGPLWKSKALASFRRFTEGLTGSQSCCISKHVRAVSSHISLECYSYRMQWQNRNLSSGNWELKSQRCHSHQCPGVQVWAVWAGGMVLLNHLSVRAKVINCGCLGAVLDLMCARQLVLFSECVQLHYNIAWAVVHVKMCGGFMFLSRSSPWCNWGKVERVLELGENWFKNIY